MACWEWLDRRAKSCFVVDSGRSWSSMKPGRRTPCGCTARPSDVSESACALCTSPSLEFEKCVMSSWGISRSTCTHPCLSRYWIGISPFPKRLQRQGSVIAPGEQNTRTVLPIDMVRTYNCNHDAHKYNAYDWKCDTSERIERRYLELADVGSTRGEHRTGIARLGECGLVQRVIESTTMKLVYYERGQKWCFQFRGSKEDYARNSE